MASTHTVMSLSPSKWDSGASSGHSHLEGVPLQALRSGSSQHTAAQDMCWTRRQEGGREGERECPSVHSQDVKEMPCQPQALQPQVVGVTVPTAHSKHKLLRWGVTGLRPPLQESASLSGFCLRSRHTGFVPNDGCKT